MYHQSLFGHLVTQFSTQPENLATESLNYILNRSSTAKQAFMRYLAQAGVDPATPVMFQTQMAGPDHAIPDLVGVDAHGQSIAIIEAKFWAGLTENQPLTYLRRLPDQTNSILLFVAPAKRFSTLWPELIQRCKDGGHPISDRKEIGNEFLIGKVDSYHRLALASWRSILTFILRALEAEGQIETAADILQLQGLCERMDDQAFLPLRSQEITGNTGTRIVQFCQLVDEATALAVNEGFASVNKLRSVGAYALYGRYMWLAGNGCFLQFNANHWARLRATPIWLSVKDHQWKLTQTLRDSLSRLEYQEPSRLLRGSDELLIPIELRLDVEKTKVIEAMVSQLREVAYLLGWRS
ncbi:MAG: hypothetical protein JOZ51_22030 [Chloroflexi bacterium]|nr:hypothetical protein [Chloroflexota bacterium]